MIKRAICTVFSKSYLPYARALMAAAAAQEPSCELFALLVDRVEGRFDPAEEPFKVLFIDDMDLPDRNFFCFRYNTLELCTASKAWIIEWLLRSGFDEVVYLDSDTCLYAPLTEAWQAMEYGAKVVLTPHLTRPNPGATMADEAVVLRAGAANTGFMAFRKHPDVFDLMTWWKGNLEHGCLIDAAMGLFLEQKWMDLAPGMFSDVHFLRDEGYNAGYWNLPTRPITKQGERFFAGKRPLTLFHFSGMESAARPS